MKCVTLLSVPENEYLFVCSEDLPPVFDFGLVMDVWLKKHTVKNFNRWMTMYIMYYLVGVMKSFEAE